VFVANKVISIYPSIDTVSVTIGYVGRSAV